MRRAGRGGESDEARQRREESLRCLQRGELPLGAVERLRSAVAEPGAARRFTSDLSAKELALTRQAGGEPLGQVLGSAVYSIGTQWRTPNWRDSDRGRAFGYELDVVTQGFANARQLALGRLRQEAALLGATGVVGVRLQRTSFPEAESLFEFAAIGTAIRDSGRPIHPLRGYPNPQRPAPNTPWLSHLSGQEYWLLRQSGCRPVALVAGNCSYYQVPSQATRQVTSSVRGARRPNQELPEYSQAVADARTRAMQRLEAEARAAGADGVVGVQVEIEVHPHAADAGSGTLFGMRYDFTVIGTAIARDPAPGVAGGTIAAIWLR
jgi:uncharacterized protein YbjQ (UPF0145 family)